MELCLIGVFCGLVQDFVNKSFICIAGIEYFDYWMLRVEEYGFSQRQVAVGDLGF